MRRVWVGGLLALVVAALAGIALGQEPQDAADSAPREAPDALPRDDPLGHVRPGIGADIEGAMAQNQAEDEHHGLLGRHLHGRGPLAFEYLYTGEVLTNTRGGISTRDATQYEGLLDLAMRIDFDKSRLPVPGKFFLLFQQTHGRGLSADFVGDAQTLSTIDSGANITQVSEYWWETPLWADFLTLRLGKQDVNGEFHHVEAAADFVHSANGIPASLPAPTYPHNSAGAVLLANLGETLTAKAGLWDGLPNGETWGFSGSGATFAIVELKRTHSLFGLPGALDVGASRLSAVETAAEQVAPEQYTVYFDFEQTLYREDLADEKQKQGLSCFARYGTVFPKTEVPFKDYLGAGLVYKGLLGGRDEDLVGAGVNFLRHDLGGAGKETATEVFYKAHLTPWATLQPVLQYIASPSGVYRDSLVAGLRFQIVL